MKATINILSNSEQLDIIGKYLKESTELFRLKALQNKKFDYKLGAYEEMYDESS